MKNGIRCQLRMTEQRSYAEDTLHPEINVAFQ